MCAYHDDKAFAIEVQLPGVEKKDIQFEMTEASFCLKAPWGKDLYFGCWTLAHNINPKKAKATYKEGLLTVTAPLMKRYKGVKVNIE
jgi:HSP20 family protein